MIEVNRDSLTGIVPALASLREARKHEPHPLHPRPGEVERYVAMLQEADREFAALLAGSIGQDDPETNLLRAKQAQISAAVRRQALLVGRRAGTDREATIRTLNGLFKLGCPIDIPLDGKHRGDLVALCLYPPLDAVGRAFLRFYMPWLGKRFDAGSQTGDNVLVKSARVVGHAFWPTFTDYRPLNDETVTAFDFTTYSGPGVQDLEIPTLKLDYELPTNPRFLIRSVLDEVTMITSNYYLGKVFLRTGKGDYRLAGFFAVRKWES